MNVAAWSTAIAFAVVAVGLPWLASLIRSTRWVPIPTVVIEVTQWIAGIVATGAAFGAGRAAQGTFIGRDALPTLAGLHPIAGLVLAAAFIGSVVWALAGITPFISVNLDQSTLLAAAGAALLVGYAAWGIGDLAVAGRDLLARLSAETTGWIQ